jgi:iron complex outermembrane receptor protein
MSRPDPRPVPLLALALAGPVLAQDAMEEIVVTSTRLPTTVFDAPLAVSAVTREDIQTARQQLGIDEALLRVPGLFVQNRYNLNQDLRIAIRGFGARAQFGINGIRIAVDDIPLTTPDGTSQVDDLDMSSIGRIEVIRGPSAALFGTAAGGAINIYTQRAPDVPVLETRVNVGEYGQEQVQAKAAGRGDAVDWLASVRWQDYEGFRDFSQAETTTFNSRVTWQVDPELSVTAVAAALDKTARDPGALTPAELAAGPPSRARSTNVNCNVRETADQYRLGAVVRKAFGDAHELRVRGYVLGREFDANLPCPFVDQTTFDRTYAGAGAQYAWTGTWLGRENRLTTGFELTRQTDDRDRFDADGAGNRGALTQRQEESVETRAVWVQDELTLARDWLLRVSARYDELDFELDDRFLSDGDDSGAITFDRFTPMVGLLWRARPELNLYANLSTAFETPTLNQLENPAGPGFNPAVDAQTAINYELGAKGLAGDRVRYQVAAFVIDLDDELVPFEQAGDTFYRNAGESSRNGLEAAVEVDLPAHLRAVVSGTWNDFTYDRFDVDGTVYDGNELPGLPDVTLYAELAWRHPSGWFAVWDLMHVASSTPTTPTPPSPAWTPTR